MERLNMPKSEVSDMERETFTCRKIENWNREKTEENSDNANSEAKK